MATLIYGTGVNGNSGPRLFLGTEMVVAQVFTAPNHFVLDNMRFGFAGWAGTYTGTIEVDFYNVDANYRPKGRSLASGSDSFNIVFTTIPRHTTYSLSFSSGYGFVQHSTYIFVAKMNLVTFEGALDEIRLDVYPHNVLPPPEEMVQSFDGGDTWTTTILWNGFTGPADMGFLLNGDLIPADWNQPLPNFPEERPDDYDPDAIWTPSEEPYTEPEWQDPGFSNYQAAGGGRWGQQLVAVGKGLVYYEQRE